MSELRLVNLTKSEVEIRIIPLTENSSIFDPNGELYKLDDVGFEAGVILKGNPEISCEDGVSHSAVIMADMSLEEPSTIRIEINGKEYSATTEDDLRSIFSQNGMGFYSLQDFALFEELPQEI